ncbi:MAG TPA: DUF1641 domain-containing protein [Alcaligenes sp.]|nr:DUF1641 domain-containing protein [Alcaligenes sp.]HRL26534.1 DUF1641 domain-containing protein [Alcaligenes sp.]
MKTQLDTGLEPGLAAAAAQAPTGLQALLGEDPGVKGLEELLAKIEPLLAGGRLNRLVDVASLMADLVDMTDDYMVEKLARSLEEGTGAVWAAGNAARMAADQVRAIEQTPSLMGLLRLAKEPDVRRGLTFFLVAAGVMGKQMRYQNLDHTGD